MHKHDLHNLLHGLIIVLSNFRILFPVVILSPPYILLRLINNRWLYYFLTTDHISFFLSMLPSTAKFRQAFLSVFGCSSISGRTPPGHPNTRGYNRSFLHSTTAVSESRSHGTEYVPLSHVGNKGGNNNSNSVVQNTYVMS